MTLAWRANSRQADPSFFQMFAKRRLMVLPAARPAPGASLTGVTVSRCRILAARGHGEAVIFLTFRSGADRRRAGARDASAQGDEHPVRDAPGSRRCPARTPRVFGIGGGGR